MIVFNFNDNVHEDIKEYLSGYIQEWSDVEELSEQFQDIKITVEKLGG